MDTPTSDTLTPPVRRRRLELATFLSAARPIAADLSATLAFYLLLAVTRSAVIAAAAGMALGVGQTGWQVLRGRTVPPLQWASLGLVVLVGGLTILTHDPRWVLFKVSGVYAVLGTTMLKRGWMARYLPPIAAEHLPDRLRRMFELAWAALMLGAAILNLCLTLAGRPLLAAQVMTVWATGAKLALFAIQYWVMRRVARPAIRARLLAAAETGA